MTELISMPKNDKDNFFALLMKRMAEKGDFPAFSESVQHLDELMRDEDKNIAAIASAILSDFTLTQKVIRLANSAMYSGMGGEITTITQAAVVLGLDAIAHIALSIRFIDMLSTAVPDSAEAREELAKAILAGDITRIIVTKSNMINGEEAVVCALLHHLGRLMLVFYFPEEWSQIQKIVRNDQASEDSVTLEVLGVTTDEISQEIARNWRLPKRISNSMASSATFDETSMPGSADWLKIMANFARDAASMLVNSSSREDLKHFVSHYSESLLISNEDIMDAIDLAQHMASELVTKSEKGKVSGKPNDSRERLAVSVQDFSAALTQGIDFNSALSMVLETIYASMGFNRVVTFFRDAGMFKAKVGFGNRMPEALPMLIFPEAYAADVFHLSMVNKADVFIQDITSNQTASSIPDWLREALPDVDAFILLPLVFNGRAVGLIYADWRMGATGTVESSELSSMGMLRDCLIQALAKRK